MSLARDRNNERRWIILGEDGRYVTLGRASDPTEDEVQVSEAALLAQGLSGWLAVMQGNPYVGDVPSLIAVRPLARPTLPFSEAAKACVRSIVGNRATFR